MPDPQLGQAIRDRIAIGVPAVAPVILGQQVGEGRELSGGGPLDEGLLAPAGGEVIAPPVIGVASREEPFHRHDPFAQARHIGGERAIPVAAPIMASSSPGET